MEKVISNNDLMSKIFLYLPIKSLLRFKSVSKNWRSIITDAYFAALRNPDPSYVSGLLCHRYSCYGLIRWNEWTDNYNPGLDFIPLENEKIPSRISGWESIVQIPSLSGIIIINSCSGLLLCLGYNEAEKIGGYHVLNPSTKQFQTLPDPHDLGYVDPHNLNCLEGIGFAYDPCKSPHFKVVIICSFIENEFQIVIYSSETQTWTASGKRFTINGIRMYLSGGVYWNGAINWLNSAAEPMFFNVDKEYVGFMPFLPIQPDNIWHEHYYFGESRGHLHFVNFFNATTQYNVYEMKNDHSEWIFKYRVDLTPMTTEYPEMLAPQANCHCSYSIVSILRDKNSDEGSIIVLEVHGKFISYNVVDKSYKIIYEREGYTIPEQGHLLSAYSFIESLSSVPCTWKPESRGETRKGRSRASSSYRSRRGRTFTTLRRGEPLE